MVIDQKQFYKCMQLSLNIKLEDVESPFIARHLCMSFFSYAAIVNCKNSRMHASGTVGHCSI